MTYLQYHEYFIKNGVCNPKNPENKTGLCYAVDYCSDVHLFVPDDNEWNISEGDGSAWWGAEDHEDNKRGEYTPMRQNVILFLAAMNGEL